MDCPRCGSAVPDRARFCPSCGAAAEAVEPTHEKRRLVTVLFADIAGSTAMGEALDPEAVRTLLARHFGNVRSVVERHGGTVEKFIGDAVMAVFGVPETHEDDALRAVRAAVEIQMAISAVNADPNAPALVSVRIGINSGEVVAGDPGAGATLVTGDAVNVAARLEQAATPGDVLIGAFTHDLVRDAVTVERLDPIAAKGKSSPIEAFRLVSLTGSDGRERHLDAKLVGRSAELAQLHAAWQALRTQNVARLVTVIAPAGVGKSRLVREFAAEIGSLARVLSGRCLPYGEGITYWPIREMFLTAAGVADSETADVARTKVDRLLASLPEGNSLTGPIASGIGLSDDSVSQDEVFWAIRRAFEGIAEESVLLVFEDLHWAEPTLLDLIEYVADLAAAPMLILATARPELLEARPAVAGRGQNATLLRIEPLAADETGELLDAQPGGSALPLELRMRITEAAEGNPLFIEEMVAMLRDDGRLVRRDGVWESANGPMMDVRVPGSVRALLAARLGTIPADERMILGRASVAGRSFESAALADLAPAAMRGDLGRRLLALVRKEMLQPDRGELTRGDAYRFRHILIRDAAYEALAKAERASLHQRFARWLEKAAGDRLPEFEEILGYHLEQAALYEAELGRQETAKALREDAAQRLLAAGLRASKRGDNGAVIPLLTRAVEYLEDQSAIEARLELGGALASAGNSVASQDVFEALVREARSRGDELTEARVLVRTAVDEIGSRSLDEVRRDLEAALPVLEAAELNRELGFAWLGIGFTQEIDHPAERHAFEQAIDYASRAGDLRVAAASVANLASSWQIGRTPVATALERIDRVEAQGVGGIRAQAALKNVRADLLAMLGRYDDARFLIHEARTIMQGLRQTVWEAMALCDLAVVEVWADNHADALGAISVAETLVQHSAQSIRDRIVDTKAFVLASAGRHEDALRILTKVDAPQEQDPSIVSLRRRARALSLAGVGRQAEGLDEIDETIDWLRTTPALGELGLALLDRATVRWRARSEGWRDDADQAKRALAEKGFSAAVAKVDALLAAADG